MKITAKVEATIEFNSIECVCPVRYADEDIPYDFPLRVKDTWTIRIDPETGKITNWPANAGAHEVHMKVCDEGIYRLIGTKEGADHVVAEIDQDYVPGFMPGDHYGDYIILDIAADGTIANWGRKANARRIQECFFREE